MEADRHYNRKCKGSFLLNTVVAPKISEFHPTSEIFVYITSAKHSIIQRLMSRSQFPKVVTTAKVQ